MRSIHIKQLSVNGGSEGLLNSMSFLIRKKITIAMSRYSRYNEHKRKTSDAEGGICFSRAISERAAGVAGDKARQRGLVSEREHERKTSDAKGGIWKTQSGDRV